MTEKTRAACAQKGPFVVQEKPGKKVWCACGLSKKQPYCDGSHSGTDFFPEIVHLDKEQSVAWCGCKQSGNGPYCDGTHKSLP